MLNPNCTLKIHEARVKKAPLGSCERRPGGCRELRQRGLSRRPVHRGQEGGRQDGEVAGRFRSETCTHAATCLFASLCDHHYLIRALFER